MLALGLAVNVQADLPIQSNAAALRTKLNGVEFEQFVDGLMTDQLRTANIAGATLSIVAGGQIVLAKGYGFADIEEGRRVDPARSLFRPGSVSKLITYTAVMQLVEKGLLDLEGEANHYLKTFQIPQTFEDPIRIRHLITHTAGFENINVGVFAPDPEFLLPLEQVLQRHVPRRVRPVDELAVYSNYGVTLAGYIVALVSEMSFYDYVEQYIFQPLEMHHSSFREPLPAPLAALSSQGYVWHKGVFLPLGFEWITNVAPAGSMSATAEDMARFMIAHLQHGRFGDTRILQAATAKTMHSQLFTNDKRLPGMAHGFKENIVHGLKVLNHRGDSQWFHSDLQLIPELNIGFFVSYNSPLSGAQRESLSAGILEYILGTPAVAAIQPPEDFAKRADRYVGDYLNMNRSYTTFEKFEEFFGAARRTLSLTAGNTLFLDAGYRCAQFVEIGPNLFRQVDGTERMAFREDAQGRISHFFLSSWPATSMEKAVPWTDPGKLRWALAGCLAIMLLFLIRLRTGAMPIKDSALGWAHWTAVATGLLQWVFLLGFGYLFKAQAGSIYLFGLPGFMKALLVLPLLVLVLTVALASGNILAWRRRAWITGMRLLHTGVVICAVFMVWFNWHFNLLGFNY